MKLKQIINEILKEGREVQPQKVLMKIGKTNGLKLIDSWSLSDGGVGLFNYTDDGNAYEIVVRPVKWGKFKNLWGKLIK